MDAPATRTHNTLPRIMHYWGLVKDIDDSLKKELAKMLIDSLTTIVTPSQKEKQPDVDDFAGTWASMDDEMLNAALAKFHKDWGGNGTAMEIAEELGYITSAERLSMDQLIEEVAKLLSGLQKTYKSDS